MIAGVVMLTIAQTVPEKGLTSYNPASHLIWVVGGIILLVLIVLLGWDLLTTIREKLGGRRRSEAPQIQGEFRLKTDRPSLEPFEPERPKRRTLSEGRPNPPQRHDG